MAAGRSSLRLFDTIIVGGGLVGSAIAAGIARRGNSVAMLDGSDRDLRASRGNFGLVWVQGKGVDYAPYARWSVLAGQRYREFEQDLRADTGVDIQLTQPGGVDYCLNDEELAAREAEMKTATMHTKGDFQYEMLDHNSLKKRIPLISRAVAGASFSPHDGHLNPLYLLKGLHQWFDFCGGHYRSNARVAKINKRNDECVIDTERGEFRCEKVVLCAGLDNPRLTSSLGMDIPIHPVRGQLLITERIPQFLDYPSIHVRQTAEGTIQIGDSHEHTGLDDGTTLKEMTKMADRALRIFPHLEHVKLNRAWGALRVMTKDGLPVYQHSESHPGAFAMSCHSGVSLAAMHCGPIADWVVGDEPHPLIAAFSMERSDV